MTNIKISNACFGSFPHRGKRFRVFGIVDEVDEFMRVILQIVQELIVFMVKIANVLVPVSGNDQQKYRDLP